MLKSFVDTLEHLPWLVNLGHQNLTLQPTLLLSASQPGANLWIDPIQWHSRQFYQNLDCHKECNPYCWFPGLKYVYAVLDFGFWLFSALQISKSSWGFTLQNEWNLPTYLLCLELVSNESSRISSHIDWYYQALKLLFPIQLRMWTYGIYVEVDAHFQVDSLFLRIETLAHTSKGF